MLQACLAGEEEVAARRELDQHLRFFAHDDVAASHLLGAMSPPKAQRLGAWQASYDSDSPLLIPEFFLMGERLLLVISELSVLDTDATFMGAMMKCLLSGPYRSSAGGESTVGGARPGAGIPELASLRLRAARQPQCPPSCYSMPKSNP